MSSVQATTAPGSDTAVSMLEAAKVSQQVASHTRRRPLDQGMIFILFFIIIFNYFIFKIFISTFSFSFLIVYLFILYILFYCLFINF